MANRPRVTTSDEFPPEELCDRLQGLRRRAINAGLTVSTESHQEQGALRIQFAGDNGLTRIVTKETAPSLEAVPFEDYVQLGRHAALYNSKSGLIEAGVRSLLGPSPAEFFGKFRGVEVVDRAESASWKIAFEGGVRHPAGEFGPPTADFGQLTWANQNWVTIKLAGSAGLDAAAAHALLEKTVTAMFFEIDLRYGYLYSLCSSGHSVGQVYVAYAEYGDVGTIPEARNTYSQPPVELYFLGRLQENSVQKYLSLYQAIEYFFPSVVEAETIQSVVRVLRNPRHGQGSEDQAREAVAAVRRSVSSNSPERLQLQSTLSASLTADQLRTFIQSRPDRFDYFTAKNQALAGVQRLQLNPEAEDLVTQVARRVGILRNRIVHAKSSLSDEDVGPLWPNSDEAEKMEPDVELMEYLVQQLIIAYGVTR